MRARLIALTHERDALAERSRELEVALAATSLEAQRRAAEAVQLQALLDFYEHEQPTSGDTRPAPGAASEQPGAETAPEPGATTAASTASGAAVPALTKPLPRRRTSAAWTLAWRDAAQAALREHGAPMHYRELYRVVAGRGFPFGGKSPEATFLASLHRERTTFQNAGKGLYGLIEPTDGSPPVSARPTRRGARRPRPIGRHKVKA